MIRLIGVETRGKIIVKYHQDSMITLSPDVYYIGIKYHWLVFLIEGFRNDLTIDRLVLPLLYLTTY